MTRFVPSGNREVLVHPNKSGKKNTIHAVIVTIPIAYRIFFQLLVRYFILSLVIAVLPMTKTAPRSPQIAPAIMIKGICCNLKLLDVICYPNLIRPALPSAIYYPSRILTQMFSTKVAKEEAQKVLSSMVNVQYTCGLVT